MDKFKQLANYLRIKHLDILSDQVRLVERELIIAHNSIGERPSDQIVRRAIASNIDEMLSVNALISALKYGGRARSIILINGSGQAIDLLNFEGIRGAETNIKVLNEDQLFNQVLDNHTLKG